MRTWRSGRWALAWLAAIPVALVRAGTLAESDTFWQVRTGDLVIDHRALPTVDPFSWTALGRPWTLNSWGFDVLAAGANRLGGLAAVGMLGVALVMAVVAAELLLARRLGAAPFVAGAASVAAITAVAGWLSVRPQLIDYVGVLVLVALLARLAEIDRRPGPVLAGLVLLTIGWVNLHATVLLAVGVSGTAAVLSQLSGQPRAARNRLWGAVVATAAGALFNPQGWGVVTESFRVSQVSVGVVTEWSHLDPTSWAQLLALAAGLLALTLAWRHRWVAVAAGLLVATAGAVYAQRLIPLMVVLAAPVLAAALSGPVVRGYLHSRRVVLVPGAVAVVTALTVMAVPAVGHLGQPDPTIYPDATLMARIPSGCHLFTTYLLGGFVILERPDVPVSVDSRNDVYGRAAVLHNADIVRRATGNLTADLQGADCVLVPPTSGLARRLDDAPGWRADGRESAAGLFVRT